MFLFFIVSHRTEELNFDRLCAVSNQKFFIKYQNHFLFVSNFNYFNAGTSVRPTYLSLLAKSVELIVDCGETRHDSSDPVLMCQRQHIQ